MLERIAQARIHIGLVGGALAYWFALSTPASILAGALIALPGEALRVWASGHLEKEREVTRSGPYRFMRHPLYGGSFIIGIGFSVAAWSVVSAAIVLTYLGATLALAITLEEATLERRYGGEYPAYREGRTAPMTRAFSVDRLKANREYRAVIGFVVALALLWVRMQLRQ